VYGALTLTEAGLYCPAGDFYIDPWKGVPRAIITHAHSDHARAGSEAYLCARSGLGILAARIGTKAPIEAVDYSERIKIKDAVVSLHPAGHVLGSSQIRIEVKGHVTVITGDYKRAADASCERFELVRCHTFISEATFGLPVYRWPDPESVFAQIQDWWQANREAGRTSILFAYALGKAQRLLVGLKGSTEPIFLHGSVTPYLPFYEEAGVTFPSTRKLAPEDVSEAKGRALIIAPGSAQNTPWIRRLAPFSLGFASGWMRVRGARRRQALDRGFIISDHVDWPDLMRTIRETGAEQIGLTHGSTGPALRWLREQGYDCFHVPTRFAGEEEE
jgi:putative mRNA 3-end processing factor